MAISVGSVEVDVIPNTRDVYNRLRSGLVPAATTVGDDVGRIIGQRIAANISPQISDAIRSGVVQGGRAGRVAAGRQGGETAGAFARTLRARLEQAYRTLPQPDVRLGTTGADADLARLRARMQDLAGRTIGVDIDEAEALRRINDLDARLQRLGESSASIAVRADTAAARAQLAQVRAQLDDIDGDRVDVDTSSAVRSLSNLTTAAAAFGPVAIPALAGVTAAVGALGAALAAAGAGAGVFGVALAGNLKQLGQQRKEIAKAEKQVEAAQERVASADTSDQRAAAAERLAEAQKRLKEAQDALSPSARRANESMGALSTAWAKFLHSTQEESLGVAVVGMDAMARALPKLKPLFDAAASAARVLAERLAGFVDGGGLERLVGWLASTAKPQILAFATAASNVLAGIGGIFRSFTPAADNMTAALVRVTARFREWGQSGEGVRSLLAYVRQTGPGVTQAMGNIGGALLNLVSALAPLGGTATAFLNAVASGVRAIPVPVLTTLGVAFASVAIGAKLAAAGLAIWRGAAAAASIATKLLTGQTLALNAAQRANVIGIIVTAIAALVVAVIYAWQNWEGFRNVVTGAWNAIKTAALFVWNSVLKPAFAGIWAALKAVGAAALWLWSNAIGPAFRGIWTAARVLFAVLAVVVLGPLVVLFKLVSVVVRGLWRFAFKPAFEGIGAVARWLWTNILAPHIALMRAALQGLGRVVRWLYNNVAKPVFQQLATAVVVWWAATKLIFQAVWRFVRNTLGPVFTWLRDNVVTPVWNGLKAVIAAVWNRSIKPTFDALKGGVKAVGAAFDSAVGFIGRVWDGLKSVAKKPVQFVVDTVYNNGIRKVWNTVAGFVGLKKLAPVKFATGGPVFGAGTATSDSIPALLSNNEHVWTAREVAAAGGHGAVEQLRTMALAGKTAFARGGPVVPGYAKGGGVIDWLTGAARKVGSAVMSGIDFLSSPGKAWDRATSFVRDQAGKLSGSQWAQAISQFPIRMLKALKDKLLDAVKGAFGGATGSVGAALKFAKSQAGKPYQWGGAGNPSWDCSGFMSGIQKVIQGRNPKGRLWSTFSFQGNQAPAGWKRNLRSPFMIGITNRGVGHTAGTLAGVNVESRGGDGVVVGRRARGWNSGLFGSHYGFVPALKAFDSGGYLPEGLSLAYNGTGRPEPVFTSAQANALMRGRDTAAVGGFVDGQRVRLVVGEREFDAYVDTRAAGQVRAANGQLLTTLRAK